MYMSLDKLKVKHSINTIDAHTEGEPLRIITHGYPAIIGTTILEKRQYLKHELDHLRELLMYEPRGHADMYGAIITEPCTPDADFGILFMHNEGYSSMCGHGIIAAVATAIETEALAMPSSEQAIMIDAPAGLIRAYAQYDDNAQLTVSFDNVPSFIVAQQQEVFIEGLGAITYDIAFGGAYYAYVDADALGVSCEPENQQQLINLGKAIKQAVIESYTITHPIEADLSFLYGTIFYSKKHIGDDAHSKHVCIFADGEVDRSPTGTGVSGRIALLKAQEGIQASQPVIIESIVGGRMIVSYTETIDYYGEAAVIPRVSGRSFITGSHTFVLQDNDIFPQGFLLR